MKVSDFIAKHIADAGILQVFMMTGGGAMHLNDSLGYEPRLRCLFNHHEQAGAIAAEGYARVSGGPALLNVTTGPGGVNALTGVYGAWTDSIPMLIVSGQVKRETMVSSYELPDLRQLGDQEIDIISMARGITKYAEVVREPSSIRYCLEKAIYLTRSGRPGPCWLDVPIDVQAAQVEPSQLASFDPAREVPGAPRNLQAAAEETFSRLLAAHRPVIMVGTGVRLAGAQELLGRVARKIGAPLVPAWTAVDLVPSDHPLFAGRAGTIGDRAGNFAVQNSDVLLVIGSRLNIRQVSYNWKAFARHAFKIQVDVDPTELNKPTIRPDLAVEADASDFLKELECVIDSDRAYDPRHHSEWLAWCQERVTRYPVVQPSHRLTKGLLVNPYHFVEALFHRLGSNDVVVCGNGAAAVVTFQAARIPAGIRVFANSGCAAMGYDLPAAIGASIADPVRRVICLAGDGSIQLNIQELQTVAHHRLPIKIFVLNNGGYLSMRLSQAGFFRRFVGEGPNSGLSFPSIVALAQAYGIPAQRAEGEGFQGTLDQVLEADGPVICEVLLDPDQGFEPKLSSRQLADGRMVSAPLEDLYPFLPREELLENLRIQPYEAE